MGSAPSSDRRYLRDSVQQAVKIVVAGPFGVGKTTMVSTLSEIRPLCTEETMTQAGAAVDDLTGITGKTTTTVVMDFGRITLTDELALFLFGAPGQVRFQRQWRDLIHGALGALVLADTRRLNESFNAIDRLEEAGLPYAVAVNNFPDSPAHDEERLRTALDLLPQTPLMVCDVRDRTSATNVLIKLVDHVLAFS